MSKKYNWIKTSEQLPEDNQDVWFVTKEKNEVLSGVFEKRTTRNVFCWGGFDEYMEYDMVYNLDDISHWMPYFTPSPPER